MYFLLFVVILVVNTSAIDCLKRLVSKMTYYVSNGTLNSTQCRYVVAHKEYLTNRKLFL